jgi:hypothetical protein
MEQLEQSIGRYLGEQNWAERDAVAVGKERVA